MSGIYIPGMEMPTSCYKCYLKQRNGMDIVCPVTIEGETRKEHCQRCWLSWLKAPVEEVQE